jgi:hypothetical protein
VAAREEEDAVAGSALATVVQDPLSLLFYFAVGLALLG